MQTSLGKSKKYCLLVILSKQVTASLTLLLIITVAGTPRDQN